jgi:hypothetical protein
MRTLQDLEKAALEQRGAVIAVWTVEQISGHFPGVKEAANSGAAVINRYLRERDIQACRLHMPHGEVVHLILAGRTILVAAMETDIVSYPDRRRN